MSSMPTPGHVVGKKDEPNKPQPTCPPCNMVVERIINGIVYTRCSKCGLGMQTR